MTSVANPEHLFQVSTLMLGQLVVNGTRWLPNGRHWRAETVCLRVTRPDEGQDLLDLLRRQSPRYVAARASELPSDALHCAVAGAILGCTRPESGRNTHQTGMFSFSASWAMSHCRLHRALSSDVMGPPDRSLAVIVLGTMQLGNRLWSSLGREHPRRTSRRIRIRYVAGLGSRDDSSVRRHRALD